MTRTFNMKIDFLRKPLTPDYFKTGATPGFSVTTVMLTLVLALLLAGCSDPSSKPAGEYLISAWGHLEENQLNAAEIEIRNGINAHPDNADLRAEHAKIFNLVDNGAAAEVAIIKARELGYDPEKAELILLEAKLLQNLNDEVIQQISEGKTIASTELEATRQRLLAEAYLANRKLDEARATLEKARSLNPEDFEIRILSARLTAFGGDVEQAKTDLGNLLASQPQLGNGWALMGDIHRYQGELEAAVDAYTKAIDNTYNNRRLLFNRAISNLGLKNFDAVRRDARIIQGQQDQDQLAVYLNALADMDAGDDAGALAKLQVVHAKNENFPTINYFLGVAYLKAGNTESAENHFELHLAQYPGLQEKARLLLASTRAMNGNIDGANEAVNAILINDPTNAVALNLKSQLLLLEGEGEEASKLIQKLIAQGEGSEALFLRLGLSKLVAGESDDARQALDQARSQNPNAHQATSLLILQAIQLKDYSKALQLANEFIEQAPDLALPYSLKGSALLESGDLQGAEKAFKEAWSILPGTEPVGRSLARVYLKNRETDKAMEVYRDILQENPNSLMSRIELAQLLWSKGDTSGFELQLKEAINQNSNDPRPVVMLLRAYVQSEQLSKAINLLEKLPNNVQSSDAVREMAGLVYFQRGDFRGALEPLEDLVSKYPDNIQFKIFLASTLRELQQLDRAERLLGQALQESPNDRNLIAALAEVKLRKQDSAATRSLINRLRPLDNKGVSTHMLEGMLAAVERNYSKAAYHFKLVHDKQPSTANLNKYASMLNKAGEPDQAISLVQKWLNDNGADLASWLLLAELQILNSDHIGAIKTYRQILDLQPDNPLAMNNLANQLVETDLVEAADWASKAYEMLPENAAIIDTLAWIRHKQGDSQRALQLLREIPQSQLVPEIEAHLDEVLKAVGQ